MGIRFRKLEKKIEKNERGAHPNYSKARIEYIARARAGEVARAKATHHPIMAPILPRKHHCAYCGITH